MINIKALCKQCAIRGFCKYTDKAFDVTETIKIEHPFFIEVKCKHFRDTISNIRIRTDGM